MERLARVGVLVGGSTLVNCFQRFADLDSLSQRNRQFTAICCKKKRNELKRFIIIIKSKWKKCTKGNEEEKR